MGQTRRERLSGRKIYSCSKCRTHLADSDNLMSKNFTGQSGVAFLFHSVVNVLMGAQEVRNMTTGEHTVRDISCVRCLTILGWRYDRAKEPSQRYKEGKFILERAYLVDSIQEPIRTNGDGGMETEEGVAA